MQVHRHDIADQSDVFAAILSVFQSAISNCESLFSAEYNLQSAVNHLELLYQDLLRRVLNTRFNTNFFLIPRMVMLSEICFKNLDNFGTSVFSKVKW